MNFVMEQACNNFTKNKILHFQSLYQSKEVALAVTNYGNFLRKLAEELLLLTDPKTTTFLMATNTWYDTKLHQPVITPDTFSTMEKALDIPGMHGLDKLFSFMTADLLQNFFRMIKNDLEEKNVRDGLAAMELGITPNFKIVGEPMKTFAAWESKVLSKSGSYMLLLQKIGQLQLLRKRIQYQLTVAANSNAKQLYGAMSVTNRYETS